MTRLSTGYTFLNIQDHSKYIRMNIDKIKNVKIFDVFSGGNMPAGKKSIAINVLIQSKEKTLSQKDLDDISQKIIDIVKAKTGGTIRS